MTIRNSEEARMALFDYFVDTLVDMADPEEGDEDQTRDDMMTVVNILFEGADIKVAELGEGVINFSAAL